MKDQAEVEPDFEPSAGAIRQAVSICSEPAMITAVVGRGIGVKAGPGEARVGLGRKGSGWAQFGPRGSREVAFGRAWA